MKATLLYPILPTFLSGSKRRICFFISLLLGVICNLLFIPMALAAIVIDDFSDDQSSLGGGSPFVGSNFQAGSMLGGERDIELSSIGDIVSVRVIGGNLYFIARSISTGAVTIGWDGADNLGGISDIDYTGLGGVDLSDGGILNGIRVTISSLARSGGLSIRVYTDAGNWSDFDLPLPVIGSTTDYFIPLSSFVTQSGVGADFSNVGAVSLWFGSSEHPENQVLYLDKIEVDSSLEATKTDALHVDNDFDGTASPGDTLRYSVTVSNSNDDSLNAGFTNMTYSTTLDSNTSLVVGSVTTTQGSVTTGNSGGDTAVGIDIGSIVDGASITITYDVLIALPLDTTVSQISSQGAFSSGGLILIRTDDPAVGGSVDPTVTPISLTTIGDFIWSDRNGDGVQDGGTELGIAGVTLDAYHDANNSNTIDGGDVLLGTLSTNASGGYSFGLPNYGNYIIDVTDTGNVVSDGMLTGGQDPQDVSVALRGTDNSVDFGFRLPASDGNLTGAGGVTEPVNLGRSKDSAPEAVNLFDFTLTDESSDGFVMTVTQVRLNVTGTSTDNERTKITWLLNGDDATNVTGAYNNGVITFSDLSISIADGDSTGEIYTISGYYNDTTGLTNGRTVILSLDGDTDIDTTSPGTTMGSTSEVTNGSGTVIVDDISPRVTSVSVPSNNTYGRAANLDFTVNYNENVVLNTGGGIPYLPLTVGATTRNAAYVSGTSSSSLLFRYTVQTGEHDLDGLVLGSTLSLNGGTLEDASGNDAITDLNSIGSLNLVLVDAQSPTVAEVTPVSTPTGDSTPDIVFSSTEAGTLSVGGSCGSSSSDEGAIAAGNTTVRLTQPDNTTPLAAGTYGDCTITVTDAVGNGSNLLTLSSFVLDLVGPTVDTNVARGLNEADTGVVISSAALSVSDNVSAAAHITYTVMAPPNAGVLRNSGNAISSGATFTQANIVAGAITYDHDGSETPADTFTFHLADEVGNINDNGSTYFIFKFSITPINDPPATTVDIDSTLEDHAVMVDVLANDSDAETSLNAASVIVTNPASNGGTTVNPGTGVITYTPLDDFNGPDSFSYSVEDSNGLSSSSTLVTITVVAQNDSPEAVDDVVTTSLNTPVAVDVAINDIDIDIGDSPDPTTIVIVDRPIHGTANFNRGLNRIDYTPNKNFFGSDTFSYTIDDYSGATSHTATVSVDVVNKSWNLVLLRAVSISAMVGAEVRAKKQQ